MYVCAVVTALPLFDVCVTLPAFVCLASADGGVFQGLSIFRVYFVESLPELIIFVSLHLRRSTWLVNVCVDGKGRTGGFAFSATKFG